MMLRMNTTDVMKIVKGVHGYKPVLKVRSRSHIPETESLIEGLLVLELGVPIS
jgi:hypothetical protein